MKRKKVIAALCALAVVVSSSGGLPLSGVRLLDASVVASAEETITFHKVNTVGIVAKADIDSGGEGCTYEKALTWVNANVNNIDKGDYTFIVYSVADETYKCVAMQGTTIVDYSLNSNDLSVYLSYNNVVFYSLGQAPAAGVCDDNFVQFTADISEGTLKKTTVNVTNEQLYAFVGTLKKDGYNSTFIITGYDADNNLYSVYRADNGMTGSYTYAQLHDQCSSFPFYYLYQEAAADPAYTIMIPATVDLKSAAPVNITATGVALNEGQKIIVTLDGASNTASGSVFNAKNEDSVVTYKINGGNVGLDDANKTVAEFTDNGSAELSFAVDSREGLKYAGEHSEVLTFGVTIDA